MIQNSSQSANAGSNADQNQLCGAVLVCGAGVAGIQASLDLSAAGFRVYLLEQGPAVGGAMARLDKTFPTGDCATCIISPKLVECMRDLNIDVLTMSDLLALQGQAGNFTASVRQRPRYVDVDKCTACGECTKVCPVDLTNPFEAGIGTRKAIDQVYAQATPNAFLISKQGRAACSSGCPIDSSVQAYVALIAAGKFTQAAQVIGRENPLPSVCGRVCFHPCEIKCNRGQIDSAINIRALKRFATDTCPSAQVSIDIEPTGKSVAIIGSGPAGLAAAHSLALAGHKITVFESLGVLGGMLAVGIPDYRLPPEVLKNDIDAIGSLGVTFKTNTTVGYDISAEALEKGFDAVFIAPGAHESRKLDIDGEDCQGVIHGVDFLRKVSLGQEVEIPRHVVVVGGGNTAIDAARTAARLGAGEVTIVYRRTRTEMPAEQDEINAAVNEGIKIKYLAAPTKVINKNNRITAIECTAMELGEPDQSGRRRPLPIKGSQFRMSADMLIPAVSQLADQKLAKLFGLKTSRWGTIQTDQLTMACSRKGIFAGGDVVAGPASVIDAIAGGKTAAAAIDNYLSDRPLDRGLQKPQDQPNPLSEEELVELKKQIQRTDRIDPRLTPPSQRTADFCEVEQVYTAEQARAEAQRCLNCAGCCQCMECIEACQPAAIILQQQEKTFNLHVGAVVLTPGFEAFDARRRGEYELGFAPNVVTNVQFERILSASGPTGGQILRPSDGKPPKRLAFIQCVGSRDSLCDNDYCSSVCCMAATKEAILARQHQEDLDVTIFFLDLRAFGKDFDRYYERAKNEMSVRYVRSFISRVFEMPSTRNLRLTYVNPEIKQVEEEFDMVVLSLGLEPSSTLREQAQNIKVALNRWGFAQTNELDPLETSRPGVFVAGAFQEPKDIPDTVTQASAAAAKAMTLLAGARGTMIRTKTYPPERDITDEPPRIGVFVCHCGSNIASVVDVEEVVKQARKLPNVVFADHSIYTCADDSQEQIKEIINEHHLNRVVIASCTPRTHEPIFRDTLQDAGLNPYLLEMANIRDQCSWVHSDNHKLATDKAIDLVRMIVGRAANLMPLQQQTVSIINAALVIGGGIAGMTAALALAQQGFAVHLVEKEGHLGGTARQLHRTLDEQDIQGFLAQTIDRVASNQQITVYLRSQLSKVDGHVGDFTSTIVSEALDQEPIEIKHGVVLVATGATEQKPQTFGYGKSQKVITQLELSDRIGQNNLTLPDKPTIVMIQCVEQRDQQKPYCSRVCCSTAINNALLLKQRYPASRIMVLYRDMRTYGFREAAYRQAREKGILFVRYEPDQPPQLNLNGQLTLTVRDPSLGCNLEVNPDLVVLAAPMVPQADREQLSNLLRVPLNADGFFLEAHVKLRPVDFASEGLFLCGTAHGPKFICETIAQANAAASRATSILSKQQMPVGGQTAWVDQDKCISCMTCMHVCPYTAPHVNEHNKAQIQLALCMGCGSCTAQCPARAITLRNYLDTQILGAINSLMRAESKTKPAQPAYPDQVGIAQPSWHKESK